MHTLARLSALAALLSLSCISVAQRPAPRIRGPIEAAPSVALQGSLDPHLRAAVDLGPLAPDTSIPGVTLVFNRSAAQQADLDQLLAAQTDPASPLFHHWLTPGEFADRFDAARSDIAAAQTWLQSRGFSITAVSRDRITFSGTAAQIQQAFGAELHRFRTPAGQNKLAELHFAPASELSLPPALAPVTAAVLHLSDFRPKSSARGVHPDYTTLGHQSHFLAPADVATMYDLAPLKQTLNNAPGWGQSIAVVGQSYVPTSNGSALYNFETILGGDLNIFPVLVPGSGTEAAYPGDEGEANIDLEYSSGIASAANVLFVFTGSSKNYNVFDALVFAITQNIAPIISVSYGACEALISPTELQQYNALFQQAAAQGQTIVSASGDNGATACAAYSSDKGVTVTQQQALAVSFPASSPYVTALGGTQMAPGTFTAGASNYWSSAATADTMQSLLSYVPEVAWNEDSASIGIAASGGGSSSIFPRPSWQAGVPGIPSGSFRVVPDIALQSSIMDPGYILCTDDQAFSGGAGDCIGGTVKTSSGQYIIAGGTSFAAPIFAGFIAVLNQYEHTMGLGSVNPTLYSLAAQPSVYASAFHDITSGTSACAAGDGNCGTPGQSAYAAGVGYDQATGLGTLDFNNLATAWPSTSSGALTPTETFFSYSQLTALAGAPVPVQILVATGYLPGGPTLPTGTLAISLDGQIVNPSLALGSDSNHQGSVNYSFIAPSQAGSHVLIARYSGDATHLPSSAAYVVTVGNVLASGTISLSAQNLTVPNGGTGSTAIAITPAGGYSGELTWSLSATGGTVAQTICYLVQSASVNGPTTATVEIGAGTACSSPSGSMANSTVQRSSLQQPTQKPRKTPVAAAFVALLLFGLFPARRTRKLLRILSTVILATVALTLIGCGGGSGTAGGGGGGGGTGPQVYNITMTAKDSVNSSITASTSFTLTVD